MRKSINESDHLQCLAYNKRYCQLRVYCCFNFVLFCFLTIYKLIEHAIANTYRVASLTIERRKHIFNIDVSTSIFCQILDICRLWTKLDEIRKYWHSTKVFFGRNDFREKYFCSEKVLDESVFSAKWS